MASVTSEDIAEMLAYAKLEPFGALRDDFRAGQIAAIVANVNRDSKSEPFYPRDFFHSLEDKKPAEPILLNDPKAQADLIRSALGFGSRK